MSNKNTVKLKPLKWLKNHFKTNWKKILINYAIFIILFILFFLADYLTKSSFFIFSTNSSKWDGHTVTGLFETTNIQHNYGWIGIRSVGHVGVTFLSTKNISFIQTIGMSVLIVIFLSIPFIHSRYLLGGLALACAGDLGNMYDRFAFNGMVKDIFWIPWTLKDLGTFNLADVFLFAGMIYVILFIIVSSIFEYTSAKKRIKDNGNEANDESENTSDQSGSNNNLKMS